MVTICISSHIPSLPFNCYAYIVILTTICVHMNVLTLSLYRSRSLYLHLSIGISLSASLYLHLSRNKSRSRSRNRKYTSSTPKNVPWITPGPPASSPNLPPKKGMGSRSRFTTPHASAPTKCRGGRSTRITRLCPSPHRPCAYPKTSQRVNSLTTFRGG